MLNKRNSKKIEVARTQYSGAAGGVTTGIGVVSLVYYNPDIEKYWVIDYRYPRVNPWYLCGKAAA